MATKQRRSCANSTLRRCSLRLQDAQNDLIGVRFGLATRQTENTARLRDAKRQIARILTILAEREQEV